VGEAGPVNFRLLRDQKWDPIYVSAAGVVTNLAWQPFQGSYSAARRVRSGAAGRGDDGRGDRAGVASRVVTVPLALMCIVSVQFNVLLAVFNMIPIPPLDGGRIAVGLLPPRASMALASVERYGMLIVLVLLMFGPLGIIWHFVQAITSFFLGG
jgi:Zn-dependent protease